MALLFNEGVSMTSSFTNLTVTKGIYVKINKDRIPCKLQSTFHDSPVIVSAGKAEFSSCGYLAEKTEKNKPGNKRQKNFLSAFKSRQS